MTTTLFLQLAILPVIIVVAVVLWMLISGYPAREAERRAAAKREADARWLATDLNETDKA